MLQMGKLSHRALKGMVGLGLEQGLAGQGAQALAMACAALN